MKKLCLKLCLFIMMFACVTVFCSTLKTSAKLIDKYDVNGDGKLTYVSLGASNVNGYGLDGYLPAGLTSKNKSSGNVYGFERCPEGSYPDLIRDHFEEEGYEVEMHQMAISSMRAEELRILLDDDYLGDPYTYWRFIGDDAGKWFNQASNVLNEDGTIKEYGSLDKTRTIYRNAIKNADIVTVDIGINNFGVFVSNRFLQHDIALYKDTFANGNERIKELYAEIKAKLSPIIAKALNETGLDAIVNELADIFTYTVIGFCQSFDASIKEIRKLNPKANIVAVTIQNIMSDLSIKLSDDLTIPFGNMFGQLINIVNNYMAYVSPYADEYYFANVSKNGRVEFFVDQLLAYQNDGNPEILDKDMKDCFDVYDNDIVIKSTLDNFFMSQYGTALKAAGLTVDEFIRMGDNGAWDGMPDYKQAYTLYKNALENAYLVFTDLMQYGAKITDLDSIILTSNIKKVENALVSMVADMYNRIVQAVSVGDRFEISEEYFTYVSEATGVNKTALIHLLAFYVRSSIGNSFYAHPNRNGHKQVAKIVLNALEKEVKGTVLLEEYVTLITNKCTDGISALIEKLKEFAKENGVDVEGFISDSLDFVGKSYNQSIIKEIVEEFIDKYNIRQKFDTAYALAISRIEEYLSNLDHVYLNGECLRCHEHQFKISGATIDLTSDIALRFLVEKTSKFDELDIEKEFVVKAYYKGKIYQLEKLNENLTLDGKVYYQYRFNKVLPDEISTNVRVCIYSNDGKEYSDVLNYSVLQYCINKYNNPASSSQKALIIALVNYASSCQLYTGKDITKLANSFLTEEEKVISEKTYNNIQSVSNTHLVTNIKWFGAGLNLNKSINLVFYFVGDFAKYGLDNLKQVTPVIKVGETVFDVNSYEFVLEKENDVKLYALKVSFNNPVDLLNTFNVSLMKDGKAITETYTYNVESYAANMNAETTGISELTHAVMNFLNACKQYQEVE